MFLKHSYSLPCLFHKAKPPLTSPAGMNFFILNTNPISRLSGHASTWHFIIVCITHRVFLVDCNKDHFLVIPPPPSIPYNNTDNYNNSSFYLSSAYSVSESNQTTSYFILHQPVEVSSITMHLRNFSRFMQKRKKLGFPTQVCLIL